MKKKSANWLLLSLLVVVLDQWSKWAANHYLVLNFPDRILPFLNFSLGYNHGAAFSMLAQQGGWQVYMLSALSLIVSIVLVIWLWRLPVTSRLRGFAIALILGGAVGNLIDRLAHGVVTDFIDFHLGAWHYATFNVADMGVSIGAVLLIIDLIWLSKNREATSN